MNSGQAAECIITEGRCGWLARSADRRLGIGVIGTTREEAQARFEAAFERQIRLLEEEATPTPSS